MVVDVLRHAEDQSVWSPFSTSLPTWTRRGRSTPAVDVGRDDAVVPGGLSTRRSTRTRRALSSRGRAHPRARSTSFIPDFIVKLLTGSPVETAKQSLNRIMSESFEKYGADGFSLPDPAGDESETIVPEPYSFKTCHRMDFKNCDYDYELWGTKYRCERPKKTRCRPLPPSCYEEVKERTLVSPLDKPSMDDFLTEAGLEKDKNLWGKLWNIRDPRMGFHKNALFVIHHSYGREPPGRKGKFGKNTVKLLFEGTRQLWQKYVRPFPVIFARFNCNDAKDHVLGKELCEAGHNSSLSRIPRGYDTIAVTRLNVEQFEPHWRRHKIPRKVRSARLLVDLLYTMQNNGVGPAMDRLYAALGDDADAEPSREDGMLRWSFQNDDHGSPSGQSNGATGRSSMQLGSRAGGSSQGGARTDIRMEPTSLY
ncbi:unnamed protein product [Amoebophrya sp. A25]|nr:unnamed protein product [Amoebophrya sp. A25]|eukprot:GSA25T00022127001.1